MILRQALAEAYDYCMGFTGRCRAQDVVDRALSQHPKLFMQESARLAYKAALREAKAYMKEIEPKVSQEDVDSTNQLDLPLGNLPGMRPPRSLIVAEGTDGYVHVRYDVATWADMEAALSEKTLNIERAIARRDDHMLKMRVLKPYLQPHPARTVREACELMAKNPI